MKGEFWCESCGKSRPDRLLASHNSTGRPTCISCKEKIDRLKEKRGINRRVSAAKSRAQKYREGALPQWMYT